MGLYEEWLERLAQYEDMVCLEDGPARFTYGEMIKEIETWSARFNERGVEAGSVIGLRTDYSIHSTATILALLRRRAIVALIPEAGDIEGFAFDSSLDALAELTTAGACNWTVLSGHDTTHPLIQRLREQNSGGLVVFTSGTTGRPKAALHSIERFLTKFRKPGRRFRTLAFLLLDHIAGLDMLFYALTSGGTLVTTRSRLPVDILKLIQSHHVEVLSTSPSFLRLLCATRTARNYAIPTLRIVTYGSETMDGRTVAAFRTLFPAVEILQKYGSTEMGAPRAISREDNSLWLKFLDSGVETKIVDGILWIRCEHAILGYLNAPFVIDSDGWYCTGDRVKVEDGWIQFLGRESDVINVGGEKVAPIEVEAVLAEIAIVEDCLVVGEPHELLGEVVSARVVLTPDVTDEKESRKRIRDHCRQRLPTHKVPIRIDFVVELPVSVRQKKLRRLPGPDN